MWVSHHNIFHFLKRADRPLIWLNIVFLLAVGFVPFSTAPLGRYPTLQLPVIVYGINVVGIALSMQALLAYAGKNGLLVAHENEEVHLSRITGRWRLGALVYGPAIVLSFVDTEVNLAIYVFVLAFLVFQSALGFRSPRQRDLPCPGVVVSGTPGRVALCLRPLSIFIWTSAKASIPSRAHR